MTKTSIFRFILAASASMLLLAATNAQAKPIVCKDSQELTLSKRTIHTAGVAVIAKDNCELVLRDCNIRAGKIAIKATENAEVTLKNCDVSGRKLAIHASENAEVTVVRSTVHGALHKSENGSIVRKKSRFRKRPAPMPRLAHTETRTPTGKTSVRVKGAGHGGVHAHTGPGGTHVRAGNTDVRVGPDGRTRVRTGNTRVRTGAGGTRVHTGGTHVHAGGHTAVNTGGGVVVSVGKPRSGLKNRGALVCGGSKDMVIRNRYISAKNTAIIVKDACTLKLINCHIVGGKFGIRVMGSGDVILKNSYVQGRKAALVIKGAGDVNASSTTIYGKIRTGGSGDFNNKGKNKINRKWH